jgi:hypothetical protein
LLFIISAAGSPPTLELMDKCEIIIGYWTISSAFRRLDPDPEQDLKLQVTHWALLGREPINLPGSRLARVRYAPIATKFRSAAKRREGPLATNAVQQIASYSITSSARAGVLPDRMSTPRRPDAGVPQRPRPAPDAHASLLKLPPPQIIFCAATPAPGLRPLVWVNAP